MILSHSVAIIAIFYVFMNVGLGLKKKPLPENMDRDVYCIGCEMAIKVVDRTLARAARDQLDLLVTETVHSVCQPHTLDSSQYPKEQLLAACEHLIEEHGAMIEAVLLGHYSRSQRPSYLDLLQQVCTDLTGACDGLTHHRHNHDPLSDDAFLKFDDEADDFVVVPGKNLKIAKPMVQSRQEL